MALKYGVRRLVFDWRATAADCEIMYNDRNESLFGIGGYVYKKTSQTATRFCIEDDEG